MEPLISAQYLTPPPVAPPLAPLSTTSLPLVVLLSGIHVFAVLFACVAVVTLCKSRACGGARHITASVTNTSVGSSGRLLVGRLHVSGKFRLGGSSHRSASVQEIQPSEWTPLGSSSPLEEMLAGLGLARERWAESVLMAVDPSVGDESRGAKMWAVPIANWPQVLAAANIGLDWVPEPPRRRRRARLLVTKSDVLSLLRPQAGTVAALFARHGSPRQGLRARHGSTMMELNDWLFFCREEQGERGCALTLSNVQLFAAACGVSTELAKVCPEVYAPPQEPLATALTMEVVARPLRKGQIARRSLTGSSSDEVDDEPVLVAAGSESAIDGDGSAETAKTAEAAEEAEEAEEAEVDDEKWGQARENKLALQTAEDAIPIFSARWFGQVWGALTPKEEKDPASKIGEREKAAAVIVQCWARVVLARVAVHPLPATSRPQASLLATAS